MMGCRYGSRAMLGIHRERELVRTKIGMVTSHSLSYYHLEKPFFLEYSEVFAA